MERSLVKKITLFLFFFILIIFIYSIFFQEKKIAIKEIDTNEEDNFSSNVIQDVNYISKDSSGNEYILNASKGQIDLSDDKTVFLTDVKALIRLTDSNVINITSNFGKYNIDNYDTIFSKNVIITYIDNKIEGDYLDFSLSRNTMIISKNVVYTNIENILKADVVEININTKDTKIFMYEKNNKVNIKSKN